MILRFLTVIINSGVVHMAVTDSGIRYCSHGRAIKQLAEMRCFRHFCQLLFFTIPCAFVHILTHPKSPQTIDFLSFF